MSDPIPKPIFLWDLKRGDTFIFEDEPEVVLSFLGMDGMYAKVRALDPEFNKEMCARYDAHSDFFCIMSASPVTLKVPDCFKIADPTSVLSDVMIPPPPGPATPPTKEEHDPSKSQ